VLLLFIQIFKKLKGKFRLCIKRYQMARIRLGMTSFKSDSSEGLSGGQIVRKYKSYGHYVRHQVIKARYLSGFSKHRVAHFRHEFMSSKFLHEHSENETILCVGARFGEEVFVLREMGYLAVGIDLNPEQKNEFVLFGDVHRLAFSNQSFDKVFCNILDHVLDLEEALSEIARVLKSPGLFVAHIQRVKPGFFEARSWDSAEHFAQRIAVFFGVQPLVAERDNFIEVVFALSGSGQARGH
jgi:SAM-dependent methyltransferase